MQCRSRRCTFANSPRVLLTVGLVLSGVAMLHAAPTDDRSPTSASDSTGVIRSDKRLLDFPGGSCESFTESLTAMFPEKSVVLAPGVAGFELPPMRIMLDSIVPGLKLACGIEGELVYPEASGLRVRGALELERVSNDIVRLIGSPVVRNEGRSGRAPAGVEEARSLLVHPLGATVLSRLSIEEVRTAIDLSFELIDQVPPTIRFQESTGIFFVYGTDQQNDGFMQTIDALAGVAVQRPRRGEESRVDVDATETGPEARHRREARQRMEEIRDRTRTD